MIAISWSSPAAPAPVAPPAARIIAKFGGLTSLARALGHRHPTTVQGWQERGYVPARRQPEVLAAAERVGVPIELRDVFDLPAQPAGEAA